MLGTATSLAFEPEFRIFVPVAIVSYLIIFGLTEWQVRRQQTKRIIEVATTAVFILICVIWGAHNAPEVPESILLMKGEGFRQITAEGAAVRVENVTTLDGWQEGNAPGEHGDHRENQLLPEATSIFDRLLKRIGVSRFSGADLARMSQQDWESFLTGLNQRDRDEISRTPFTIVSVRTSDNREQIRVLFTGGNLDVPRSDGSLEGRICVRRTFDVGERGSGEHEAIYVENGLLRCR